MYDRWTCGYWNPEHASKFISMNHFKSINTSDSFVPVVIMYRSGSDDRRKVRRHTSTKEPANIMRLSKPGYLTVMYLKDISDSSKMGPNYGVVVTPQAVRRVDCSVGH